MSQSLSIGDPYSLLLGASSGGFYSFLPMPFEKARIEIENLGVEEVSSLYYILVTTLGLMFPKWVSFMQFGGGRGR